MSVPAVRASLIRPITSAREISRYPVHRLAKHGDIAINIREKTESGDAAIKWKVTHNSEYGPPGPLAYKFDTLIINRICASAVLATLC